jgi:hypothetical protein
MYLIEMEAGRPDGDSDTRVKGERQEMAPEVVDILRVIDKGTYGGASAERQ